MSLCKIIKDCKMYSNSFSYYFFRFSRYSFFFFFYQNKKHIDVILMRSGCWVASLGARKALTVELTAAISVLRRQIASMTVLCSTQAVWLLSGRNDL